MEKQEALPLLYAILNQLLTQINTKNKIKKKCETNKKESRNLQGWSSYGKETIIQGCPYILI